MVIPARRIMQPFVEVERKNGKPKKTGIIVGQQRNGVIFTDRRFPGIPHGIATEVRLIRDLESDGESEKVITLRAKTASGTESVLLGVNYSCHPEVNSSTISRDDKLKHLYSNSSAPFDPSEKINRYRVQRDSHKKSHSPAIRLPNTYIEYRSKKPSKKPFDLSRGLNRIFHNMIRDLLPFQGDGRFEVMDILEDGHGNPKDAIRDLCESYRDLAIEAVKVLDEQPIDPENENVLTLHDDYEYCFDVKGGFFEEKAA